VLIEPKLGRVVLPWPAAVREYRRRYGATQTELAQELGIHTQTVSRFERGAYVPRSGSMLDKQLRGRLNKMGIEVEA
jgi:transcriptional regulator with XRE-family HTH domain